MMDLNLFHQVTQSMMEEVINYPIFKNQQKKLTKKVAFQKMVPIKIKYNN